MEKWWAFLTRGAPVSELAARYGASVAEGASDPEQAYAGSEEPRMGPSYWDRLPWS